jgi:2-polyprenyl-6-hydroxyphenyl methylase/3-demethylubiquinone-9 3-methyltransferase
MGPEGLVGKSFLDIGCGSGLFSIAAAQCGADPVVGFDVNPACIAVSSRNANHLAERLGSASSPHFCVGSVLDADLLGELGAFDIVYAWGVLHHTGSMWQAIDKAASFVKPGGGTLVIAIYNSHWTSPVWRRIKCLYNHLPSALQRVVCYIFAGVIFIAKLVVTRSNPLQKQRGMDFWYDIVDWVGGYPYEYATPQEVAAAVEALGFNTDTVIHAEVPTGCNEFVFRRSDS